MKRVLFLSLVLLLGVSGFAQNYAKAPALKQFRADKNKVALGKDIQRTADVAFPVNNSEAVVVNRYEELTEAQIMESTYDLQTNDIISNRVVRFDDGSAAVVATFSSLVSGFSDRGTGYNYFDGSDWQDMPETRIENVRCGWPTIAPYGPDGEIVVCHSGTDLLFTTRQHKGQGAWAPVTHIPNPEIEGLTGEAVQLTWPRVTTTGPNHEVIHIVCATQDSADGNKTKLFYTKSTDGGTTWTTVLFPVLNEFELGAYSADDYAIASYGNTVAVLLLGSLDANVLVMKSEDEGETWNKVLVWENPYYGLDWETDSASIYTDTLFLPEHGSIVVDKNGMAHVALSVEEIIHDDLSTSYTLWQGLSVDGIRYWNENQGPIVDRVHTEYPETSHYYGPNQHHAMKLWWPVPDDAEYIMRDTANTWAGMIPDISDMTNDMLFNEQTYYVYFKCCSAYPSLCMDEDGIIALAYSCPDVNRLYNEANYYRSVYVSYIEFDGADIYVAQDNITDMDMNIMHMMDECINVNAAPYTKNNEYWFAYTTDMQPGFSTLTTYGVHDVQVNNVWAGRVVPNYIGMSVQEAVNPVNSASIYPNPAEENLYIKVNAAQASVMNIAVYNITGQKVMETSANIHAGMNQPSINVSDLSSGMYFVTVTANGFEETMKFVVK